MKIVVGPGLGALIPGLYPMGRKPLMQVNDTRRAGMSHTNTRRASMPTLALLGADGAART